MEINKKHVLNEIKKLLNSCELDPTEIKWFRYIMEHITNCNFFGKEYFFIQVDDLDMWAFCHFIDDYRRDNNEGKS